MTPNQVQSVKKNKQIVLESLINDLWPLPF